MILEGPNIKDQAEINQNKHKIALSLSQLIMFNTVKRSHSGTSASAIRHNREQETPFPIYFSLFLHGKTRKRELVDMGHHRGLGISYDRVLSISSALGNSVCKKFEEEQVVCPPKAKENIFTIGCMDNIDHNPSSRTAQNSFHGTAISIIQFPTADQPGQDRGNIVIDLNDEDDSSKTIVPLPQSYSMVPAVALDVTNPKVPAAETPILPQTVIPDDAMRAERDWTSCVAELINKSPLELNDFISWTAYHASQQVAVEHDRSQIFLLPLFHDNAHSPSMVLHAMHIIQHSTNHLNLGQVPIICMDQPLFALAKQIQWQFPDVGEDKFVVMMGGLHIEMMIFKMLGEWLARSGWCSMLVKADITTPGRAEEAEKASNVTRARYCHQVTAASLSLLKRQAYDSYRELLPAGVDVLSFDNWCVVMADNYPQFQYWSVALDFELTAFMFVRSIREGNFELYCQSLTAIVPWCFALDHRNYARWLPVHIRDMLQLEVSHPEIHQQFCKGNFVVQKTSRHFSCIALDHAHEQENEKIKGDGGAIGLTENARALHRWMVAGPEIARVVDEFEQSSVTDPDTTHHDQVPSIQNTFQKNVRALCLAIEESGNPFMEDSNDLYVLDTKDIMN